MGAVKGYIEIIIVQEDGTRLLFKGHGSLESVTGMDPPRQLVRVVSYIAPVIDMTTGEEVHRFHYNDRVPVFLNVRRTFRGQPYFSVAALEWRGYWIAAHSVEEVRPEDELVVAPG